MNRPSHGALLAYLVLFAALYAAFGVQSPYLPRLLQDHGLGAEAIGTVLAAGTAIRLAAGPRGGSYRRPPGCGTARLRRLRCCGRRCRDFLSPRARVLAAAGSEPRTGVGTRPARAALR